MAKRFFKTWAEIGLALALGAASAVGDEIHMHFEGHYPGPWQWETLTSQQTTQTSGMNQTITYRGTAAITGYTGDKTELVIPETIAWNFDVDSSDGSVSVHYSCEVEVREICSLRTSATTVTIPNTVTNIGDKAFDYSTNLVSVSIPGSVENIGRRAFSSCQNLASITIPDSVTSIGGEAFYACQSLAFITILGNVTNDYGDGECLGNPFVNCTNVTTLVLGEKMSKIGNEMFSGLPRLQSITIPDSVSSIGDGAFEYCRGLQSITILGNVTNDWNSGYCPFVYCTNVTTLVLGEKMSKIGDYMFRDMPRLQSIAIPGNVTNIGTCAFYGCSGATSLSIGQKVKSIGSWAFASCSSLATLAIPGNVTNIGASAFNGCTGLSAVMLGNGLKEIGASVFNNCYRLRAVELPGSVEELGAGAFYGCTALGTVGLGSVKRIGDQAFSGCTALKEAVLPDSARSIGAGAFQGCTALGTVAFPAGVEEVDAGAFSGASVKTLRFDNGEGAFLEGFSKESLRTLSLGSHARGVTGARLADCTALALILVDKGNGEYKVDGTGALYDGTGAELIKYPAGAAAETVTVPATVRRVGERAFAHSMSLKEIEFQAGVESIGDGAFDWCLALERVVFPSSLRRVGDGAFRVCPSLETVRFGGDVAELGSGQFAYGSPTVWVSRAYPGWTSVLDALGLEHKWIEDGEGGGAATASTPVAVPHEWLERKAGRILAENGGDYEAAAMAVASNGVDRVWECYVTGVEPEDEGARFVARIGASNGAVRVSWNPDLGAERRYVVEGAESLVGEGAWGATNGRSRFFKVGVGMP